MQADNEIGYRIRKARQEAGLTQEQLGERIKMSAMGISYLEKGLRKIKIEDIIEIAKQLDVKVSYLLESITGVMPNRPILNTMNNYRSDFALEDTEKKETEDKINKAFNDLSKN